MKAHCFKAFRATKICRFCPSRGKARAFILDILEVNEFTRHALIPFRLLVGCHRIGCTAAEISKSSTAEKSSPSIVIRPRAISA
jgi:hypothetical protein